MKEDKRPTSNGFNQLNQAVDITRDQIKQVIALDTTPSIEDSSNKRRRRLMTNYQRKLENDYLPGKQKYKNSEVISLLNHFAVIY